MGLDKVSSLLAKGFLIIGGTALLGLVLLATGNVAMRLVGSPYAGTYEVVSFLGAVVIGGALAHTQRRKDHIVVDIISEKFPRPLKRFLDAVNYGITCALFSIVSWQVWRWGTNIKTSGELSETLKIPFHPFIYCVAVCFASLAVILLVDFLRALVPGEEEK